MRRVISITSCLALLLVACGKSGPDMPKANDFPAPGDPEKTVVVEPGTNGQVLRFKPKAGGKDRLKARVDMETSVDGGGQSADVDFGMEMVLENEVTEVEDGDRFTMSSVISDTKLELGGQLAAMADTDMMSGMMDGTSTKVSVDTRGRVLELKFEGGNPLMDQMEMGLNKSFQSGFVPLPDEPIGAGGSWDALGHMDAMGAKVRLAARYKLLSLEGSRAKLELTMRGTADRQQAEIPGAPVSVEIVELSITGRGTMTVDFERPTSGELDLEMAVKAEMSAQGETVSMKMSMKMTAKPM